MAAEAIYWAAHHRRREIYVGLPTVIAIWGNSLVPGLADRYLGKTGYDSQQYDGPDDPNRPNNLWQPVPGDQFELRVPLPGLPNGVYTVTWRTVSKTDGHVTGGAFAFGVGTAPTESLPDWRRRSETPR